MNALIGEAFRVMKLWCDDFRRKKKSLSPFFFFFQRDEKSIAFYHIIIWNLFVLLLKKKKKRKEIKDFYNMRTKRREGKRIYNWTSVAIYLFSICRTGRRFTGKAFRQRRIDNRRKIPEFQSLNIVRTTISICPLIHVDFSIFFEKLGNEASEECPSVCQIDSGESGQTVFNFVQLSIPSPSSVCPSPPPTSPWNRVRDELKDLSLPPFVPIKLKIPSVESDGKERLSLPREYRE